MEIPLQAHVLAVDLEGVERLVAAGIPCAFEEAERSVLEVAEEGAGIVDAHLLDLAGELVLPFLHERLGHRGDVGNLSIKPDRRVDAVGEQVARHTRAGGGGVEPPKGRAPLRQVGIDRPVLEKISAVVEDPAELAAIDDVLRERHRRDAAVVVPDHVRHAGLLDGGAHLLTLGHVHRQRLLAEDRLAVLRRLDGDLSVEVVGRADIDGVDVIGGDELPPVGLDPLVSPAVGEGFCLLWVAGGDSLQHGQVFQVEEILDAVVAVGVGAAHEAVADHADAEGFCHGVVTSWKAF